MQAKLRWRDAYPVGLFVLCLMSWALVGTTPTAPATPPPAFWAQLREPRKIERACARETPAGWAENSCRREQAAAVRPRGRIAQARLASGPERNPSYVKQ